MDIDGDGTKDILSGNYVTDNDKGIGSVHVLKGLGDGKYAKATELLNRDGKPVVAAAVGDDDSYDGGQICIHPFAVDWDGDNDLDLVIGNFVGSFTLVLNEKMGGEEGGNNAFAKEGVLIKADGSDAALNAGNAHSAPFVVDWDKDGDLDLLSASTSSPLCLAENIGTREAPRFKSFRELIKVEGGEGKGPAGSFRSWLADVNGDGKLDVLAGDSFTLDTPKDGFTPEQIAEKQKAWEAEMNEAQKPLEKFQSIFEKMAAEGKSPQDDPELMEKYQKAMEPMSEIYGKRAEFIDSQMTGRVWLYVAK